MAHLRDVCDPDAHMTGAAHRGSLRKARSPAFFLAIAMACGIPQAAHAQDVDPTSPNSSVSSDWIVTLGAWGNFSPEYSGSNRYDLGGSPIIDFADSDRGNG